MREFLSTVHLIADPPALIVVEDLSSFWRPTSSLAAVSAGFTVNTAEMAKTLAFLKDTVEHLNNIHYSIAKDDQTNAQPGKCLLLVTDSTFLSPELLTRHIFLYERWLPLVLRIESKFFFFFFIIIIAIAITVTILLQ